MIHDYYVIWKPQPTLWQRVGMTTVLHTASRILQGESHLRSSSYRKWFLIHWNETWSKVILLAKYRGLRCRTSTPTPALPLPPGNAARPPHPGTEKPSGVCLGHFAGRVYSVVLYVRVSAVTPASNRVNASVSVIMQAMKLLCFYLWNVLNCR